MGRLGGESRTVGRQSGDKQRAKGQEPRVGDALGQTRSHGTGASHKQRDRESDSFAFWAFLLGFVELGPQVVYDTLSVPK